MVKYCFISPTTSHSCELEPTMIKSSTCTAMNTLRARSTKSVGCASDRVKPSRDVSTAAKCSWKSREASLKPFKSSLETPNRIIVLVETLRRFHAHRVALRHGRVHESNTNITEQSGEVFRQSHRQQHSRDLEPKSGTVEVCVQRICELPHHKMRSHLFWSLSPVTPTCGPDFAGHLNSRNCLNTGKLFIGSSSRFTPSTTSSRGSSSNVSSSK